MLATTIDESFLGETGRKIAPLLETDPNDEQGDEQPQQIAYCDHCGTPILDGRFYILDDGRLVHDTCDWGLMNG